MSKYLELVEGSFNESHFDKQQNQNPYVAYSINDDRVIYSIIPEPVVYDPWVTFTAEETNSTIGLFILGTNQTLEYSTDTTNWTSMNNSTNIKLSNIGDKAYIRGILRANGSSYPWTQFKMTGKIAASGNCNALWNYTDLEAPLKAYCGYKMFSGCTSLTAAPDLPVTTLTDYCYYAMFEDCSSLRTTPKLPPATTLAKSCYNSMFCYCSSLTTAPKLPTATLAENCYSGMFAGCSSLTTAPKLPATTLAKNCYSSMFSECTSLTIAPELPATTLAESCYREMFYKCTSLTTTPELPAMALAYMCYFQMFENCTSLTTVPELPATTLAAHCYNNMFSGCTSLNYIKCLATDISAENCTNYWVNGVSSTGTFIKPQSMTSWATGVSGIPEGWTIKDTYTPQECVELEITADNVSGRKTNTTIHYTALTNGIDDNGNRVEGQIITGIATSNEFEQNNSYTDTVERTITFEFIGVTATTTITQGVWIDNLCQVVLNDQWRLSETQSNPDSALYDGVYESFSNKGVDSGTATMYLDLIGYTEFDVYIRSYAESRYDYVTISEPNSGAEKASTKGNQNSSQDINSYTKVHYDNLTGEDRITITYLKDSSGASGDDRGYVLIPKQ